MSHLSPTLGLIGFGAFGRLMAAHLAPHLALRVYDPAPAAMQAAGAAGCATGTLAAVAQADILLLAVPVRALEACLAGLAPHLRPGQMVVETCSVKSGPSAVLARMLPPGVRGLASHPMFGPQSAALGLAGHQVVLCPLPGAAGQGWRQIAAFLRQRLSLRVIVTTAEDHDRQAALSQGLTHLLARAIPAAISSGIPAAAPQIRTRSFDLLMQALDMVRHDAPEVFEAVTAMNPHVAELRARLLGALAEVSPEAR